MDALDRLSTMSPEEAALGIAGWRKVLDGGHFDDDPDHGDAERAEDEALRRHVDNTEASLRAMGVEIPELDD